MQVIGSHRRAEASATIKDEFGIQVGKFAFDVALDDALAEMDRSGQVVGIEFAVFADVDENEFVATIDPGFDGVNSGFSNALLGVVDDLEEAGWMVWAMAVSKKRILPLWQNCRFQIQMLKPFFLRR